MNEKMEPPFSLLITGAPHHGYLSVTVRDDGALLVVANAEYSYVLEVPQVEQIIRASRHIRGMKRPWNIPDTEMVTIRQHAEGVNEETSYEWYTISRLLALYDAKEASIAEALRILKTPGTWSAFAQAAIEILTRK